MWPAPGHAGVDGTDASVPRPRSDAACAPCTRPDWTHLPGAGVRTSRAVERACIATAVPAVTVAERAHGVHARCRAAGSSRWSAVWSAVVRDDHVQKA